MVRDWGLAPLPGLSPEAFLGKRRPSSQEATAEATDEPGAFMLRGGVCACVHMHARVKGDGGRVKPQRRSQVRRRKGK